ncbi:hypothetical protein NC651_036334 [Populus alba x Populus x berolinensis]|nr:hypothetical protein NC651_036334 [Populus alba x Populus x berolinensis]
MENGARVIKGFILSIPESVSQLWHRAGQLESQQLPRPTMNEEEELMHRTKTTTRRSHRVATSSFSTENDMYLGVNQEESHAPSTNAASSNAVSQIRGGVPL